MKHLNALVTEKILQEVKSPSNDLQLFLKSHSQFHSLDISLKRRYHHFHYWNTHLNPPSPSFKVLVHPLEVIFQSEHRSACLKTLISSRLLLICFTMYINSIEERITICLRGWGTDIRHISAACVRRQRRWQRVGRRARWRRRRVRSKGKTKKGQMVASSSQPSGSGHAPTESEHLPLFPRSTREPPTRRQQGHLLTTSQSVSTEFLRSYRPSFLLFLSFFLFFFFPPTTYLPRHHASNLLPLSHFASSPRRVVTVAVDCSVFTDAARLRDVEWSA